MGLLIKMETEIEIKATAERFYQVFRTRPHHLPTVCSDINTGEVHDGEWDAHGSSRKWTYKFGGKTEIFREKIAFDDENKKVTHVGFDGDVFKRYKVYNASWQAIPKAGGDGGIVKVVIEYEKLNKDALSPDDYLEMLVGPDQCSKMMNVYEIILRVVVACLNKPIHGIVSMHQFAHNKVSQIDVPPSMREESVHVRGV